MRTLLRSESGTVLVLALGVLIVLAVFALGVGRAGRQSIVAARWQGESVELRQTVLNGFEYALAALEDNLARLGRLPETSFQLTGGTSAGTADASEETADAMTHFTIKLSDENARLNVNTASSQSLQCLPGFTGRLADVVLDWRDSDETPRRQGAESDWYRRRPIAYEAKNAPIESVEELLLVRGIQPEFLDSIRSLITVYGDGKVNVNTCPATVLHALGVSPDVAKRFVGLRDGQKSQAGVTDDLVFTEADSVLPVIQRRGTFDADESAEIQRLIQRGAIVFSSNYFRVRVTARLKPEGPTHVVEAVVRRHAAGDFSTVYWSES